MNAVSHLLIAASFTLTAIPAAFAQQGGHHNHHAADPAAKDPASAQLSEGEVRKVDKDAKKLTIKHGDLRNLGMPPMTMVFQVREPAILDQIKAGDKINFVAEEIGGKLIATKVALRKSLY
jgi:Cu(I)/Ag(I) efflux system periplasmic protein CusF